MPVLAGLSRKRMIGEITGRGVDERIHGSVAAALIAAQNGAMILRVHDVAATVDALKVWLAVAAVPMPRGKPAGFCDTLARRRLTRGESACATG